MTKHHTTSSTSRLLGPGLLALLFTLLSALSWADSDTPGKTIAGWVEKVTVLEEGHVLKAKLDTGARTSSIHAINIENIERDGETWVRFDVITEGHRDDPEFESLERPRVRKVRIKEHEGEFDRRPVVELPVCFDGRWHDVQFTLVDRSRFIYPMILGRLFLKGKAVVDPETTFLTQARCEKADNNQ